MTQTEVLLPIAISGLSQDLEVTADAETITIDGGAGKTWSSGFAGINQQSGDAGELEIKAYLLVDSAFFQDVSAHPVTVRASLYLSVFGNSASSVIPVRPVPAPTVAELRCGTGFLDQLHCQSVFRWPRGLVYAQFGGSGPELFTPFVSYSPFPANLEFNPVEQHWVSTPRDATEATIIAKKPLSHFRKDVAFKEVRLSNFTRAALLTR